MRLDEFDELPPLIGPIKKSKHIDLDSLGFGEIDNIGLNNLSEFYLDYDGFYSMLELNNFNIKEYLNENQIYQITLLAEHFNQNHEFEKSIKLVLLRFDWILEIYTSEENYKMCAKTLEDKKIFLLMN